MNQSNFIFFALLLAFMVYITMRGELPTYMGFFVPNPNAGSVGAKGASATAGNNPSTPSNPTGSDTSNPNSFLGNFARIPFIGILANPFISGPRAGTSPGNGAAPESGVPGG